MDSHDFFITVFISSEFIFWNKIFAYKKLVKHKIYILSKYIFCKSTIILIADVRPT